MFLIFLYSSLFIFCFYHLISLKDLFVFCHTDSRLYSICFRVSFWQFVVLLSWHLTVLNSSLMFLLNLIVWHLLLFPFIPVFVIFVSYNRMLVVLLLHFYLSENFFIILVFYRYLYKCIYIYVSMYVSVCLSIYVDVI